MKSQYTQYLFMYYNTLIISKTLWLLKIQFKYFSRTFQNKNIWSENVNYYYYIWFFFLILLCHFKNNMFKLSDRICNTLKEAFMTRICCCCFLFHDLIYFQKCSIVASISTHFIYFGSKDDYISLHRCF